MRLIRRRHLLCVEAKETLYLIIIWTRIIDLQCFYSNLQLFILERYAKAARLQLRLCDFNAFNYRETPPG
jgi:hypothetical protein